jgi:hypothetical protein
VPGASWNRASPSKIRQYQSESITNPPPSAMPQERTRMLDHFQLRAADESRSS